MLDSYVQFCFIPSQVRTHEVLELNRQLQDAREEYAKMESGYLAVKAQAEHCHSLAEQVSKLRSGYAKLQEENQVLRLKVSAYRQRTMYACACLHLPVYK